MTKSYTAVVAAVVLLLGGLGWTVLRGVPDWMFPPEIDGESDLPTLPPAPPPPTGPKINAHLYYVAEDGVRLTRVDREVGYAEGVAQQARALLDAQLAQPTPPLVSAIPAGSALRAVFVTPEGEAYADFSGELVSAHPGGSVAELLTVYTLVDVLTTNLPAIKTVQILVEGKELDTLVGHIDVSRPLASDLSWIE